MFADARATAPHRRADRAVAAARAGIGFHEQQTVDAPQAGMAGAATGAAMGAGIDLLTGGLTLGAAAALGAMIGGGAAYAAAAWKNRGSATGQPQVQLGDELLQTLHRKPAARVPGGRPSRPRRRHPTAPPAWRSEVVAAVEARRAELAARWAAARDRPTDARRTHAWRRSRAELEEIARGAARRACARRESRRAWPAPPRAAVLRPPAAPPAW